MPYTAATVIGLHLNYEIKIEIGNCHLFQLFIHYHISHFTANYITCIEDTVSLCNLKIRSEYVSRHIIETEQFNKLRHAVHTNNM
jgi:hypothetical protein